MSNWRIWARILSFISTVSGLVVLTERRFDFELPSITEFVLGPYLAVRHVFFTLIPDILRHLELPAWSFQLDEQDLIIISVAMLGLIIGTFASVIRENGLNSTFSALLVGVGSAVLLAILSELDAAAEEPFYGQFSVGISEFIRSLMSYLVSSSSDAALMSSLQFIAKGLSVILIGLVTGPAILFSLLIMFWVIDLMLGMNGTLKLADANIDQDSLVPSIVRFLQTTFQSLFSISLAVFANLAALGLGYLSAIEGFFLDRIL